MKVAWPLVVNMASVAMLNFSDRLFLSWYDEAAFRASLPAGILFFTLTCGFMGLAGFVNTFVAQYRGAGDPDGCARSTAQGIWMALVSFPLILALTPVGTAVLRMSGHGPETFALEARYLRILMWSGGGMALSSALGGFFSGRGKTLTVMTCSVLSNALNVVLNYLFIFGKGGFPEMGIAGAGRATVIGAWTSAALFALIYFSPRLNARYRTWRNLRFDPALFRRMLRFGAPAGIHWFLDVAAFTVFVLLVGRLGAKAHVASNMALSINLIAFMPTVGIGVAASILTGQYLGRGLPEEAERVGRTAWRIAAGYVGCIGLSFLLFPSAYLRIFAGRAAASISAEELLPTVRVLLAVLSVWGLADAAVLTFSGVLKGAGDTRFVMWFQSLVAWGILVPGQLALVLWLEAGLFASWAWTLLYVVLLAAGFFLRYRSGRWKRIDLLDRRISSDEVLHEA